VSGISYEQYVEENIFAPLGMQRSSVRRPVAPELEADVSWGHVGGPVGVIPLIEYFPAAPMVGVSATVTDMAKFMIAQLQKGRYGDRRILAEETADMMQQQQFHPRSAPAGRHVWLRGMAAQRAAHPLAQRQHADIPGRVDLAAGR
jgi:CubicO group peptidase (beta-lactamase class C family)